MNPQSHITLSGTPEGFDARALARELAKGAPVIHIARDDKRLEAMRAALGFFAPEAVALTFPAWIACPMTGFRPTPTFQPRAWQHSPRWHAGFRAIRAFDHPECRNPTPSSPRCRGRGCLYRQGRIAGERGGFARLSGADGLFTDPYGVRTR